MHVLHLIETDGPGGAENMLLRLTDEYAARGIKQTVGLRLDTWLASKVRERNVDLWVHELESRIDLAWLRAAARLVRERGITAIHAHEFTMIVHGGLLSAITRLPCTFTVHGRTYYTETFARRAAMRLSGRFGRFVAVSKDIGTILSDCVGVPESRISVIPTGIDPAPYRRDAAVRNAFRESLGIGPQDKLVGSIGSLYPVKGHRYLIEAAAMLQREDQHGESIKYIIVGQGDLQDTLQQSIDDCGLSSDVRLLGFRDDIPAVLNAIDLLVLPSLSEGLPLCLLEAAAAGAPIVATRVGGVPDFLCDGDIGWLCPPEDAASLAKTIREALTSKESPAKAARASDHVESHYSSRAMTQAYLATYEA